MSINSTEAQASGESKITGHSMNPSIHKSAAWSHSLTLSHLLLRSMSSLDAPLAGGSMPSMRLTFQPQDPDFPMREEIIDYASQVNGFWVGIRFMLTFLQVDNAMWPPAPDTNIQPTLTQDFAIWQKVTELSKVMSQMESFLKDAQISTTQQEKEQLCQNSVGGAPHQQNFFWLKVLRVKIVS